MHFHYAFLMAPRFFRNMHFSMGKCIIFFAFLLAAENAYFIFRWFCPKTKVFMELCIFDGSKICQKYAFFHGKMHIFLLFGWLQKMHISYFVDFVQKPRFSWNYAFLMAPRFFPEIWNYAFSAASRKAKKYAFSHGKMHISQKSWSHQKCIIPWEPWFLDKINEIWNMHFLQPAEKQTNMHFPMEKCIFQKNLGTIKNA